MKKVHIEQILKYLEQEKIPYEYIGSLDVEVKGFSSLHNYQPQSLTWQKKEDIEIPTDVRLCVVEKGLNHQYKNAIITPASKLAFFGIIENLLTEKKEKTPIGFNTYIGEDVAVGEGVTIGNNCNIDGNIVIGNDTIIGDNVVIKNKVTIGEKCTIQSLSVIGEDGFGYTEKGDIKTMIDHYGGVKIGNNVFIGNHVNIARGTIDDTIIESGVKIAPSSHIGHNNHIGANAVIICSKLYGSVNTGENAYITASVVRNQCDIGKNVLVGMGSVVTNDVQENKVVIGAPAKVLRDNK